jgi:hypothetical protein
MIQAYIAKWENQLDKRVKVVRSDGGAEFGAGANGFMAAKAYWKHKGTLHTIDPPGNHKRYERYCSQGTRKDDSLITSKAVTLRSRYGI